MHTDRLSSCVGILTEVVGTIFALQVVTRVGGIEYRYTEWPAFNTLTQPSQRHKPDWQRLAGVELYNHSADPGENFNVWALTSVELRRVLANVLHAGPI